MSRKPISLLVAVSLLFMPLRVTSAGTLTADDSIAGLGADIVAAGFAPSTDYTLTVEPPAGADVVFKVKTDAEGGITASLRPEETEQAGRYRARIGQGTASITETTFEILPETVDVRGSDVRALTSRVEPDGFDEAEIVVTLRDRFGNALAGRPVTLVSSRGEDTLYALSQETDAAGVQRFVLSTRAPGYSVVRAIDLLSGNTLAQSVQIQAGDARAVGSSYEPTYAPAPRSATSGNGQRFYFAGQAAGSFDVIDNFEIVVDDALPAGQEAADLVIRAVDRAGNTVEDYVGTIVFSSTDPDAQLPNFGSYTFKDRDLGEKSFPLILKFEEPGVQTLRVQDSNDPSLFGEAQITVTGHSAAGDEPIVITKPEPGVVGSPSVTLEGIGPVFSNLVVEIINGSKSLDVDGSTDGNGNFEIALTLPTGTSADYSIVVREKEGRAKSEPLFLTLDASAPQIGTITFAPEKPIEGDKVLVVMQAEADLSKATMSLADKTTGAIQETTLNAVAGPQPAYQGFFTAPAAGDYQPIFTVIDAAGNKAELRATLKVEAPGLPAVRNLKAEPRATAVELEWDALPDQVDEYRIYVGESPDDLSLAVSNKDGLESVKEFDTARPTNKATMVGLKPATTYYFAVTALQGNRESEALSNIADARTLGITLTVKPQRGALQLQWSAAPKELPLKGYRIHYATTPEERDDPLDSTPTIDVPGGSALSATIPYLIDGIRYYVKLTPIAATEDPLNDLAAAGDGVPSGDGFHASPSDPIPFDAANPILHEGAPLTPSGLPLIPAWAVGSLALGGCGVYWRRRRAKTRTAAFLQAVQSRYDR